MWERSVLPWEELLWFCHLLSSRSPWAWMFLWVQPFFNRCFFGAPLAVLAKLSSFGHTGAIQVPAAALTSISRRRCWLSFKTYHTLGTERCVWNWCSDTKSIGLGDAILTNLPSTATAAGPCMAAWGGWIWGPWLAVWPWGEAVGQQLQPESRSDAVRGRGVRTTARIFLSCV